MKPNLRWTIDVRITFESDFSDDKTFRFEDKIATHIRHDTSFDDIEDIIMEKVQPFVHRWTMECHDDLLIENPCHKYHFNPDIDIRIIIAQMRDNKGVWVTLNLDNSLDEYTIVK